MNALGTHLLLDLRQCDPELLDDIYYVKQTMIIASSEAGATILSENFHKFSPLGVTGVIAIAESHLSIHTWPEYSYAAADIFTCGETFKPRKAAAMIIQQLQCSHPTIKAIQRGLVVETPPTPINS